MGLEEKVGGFLREDSLFILYTSVWFECIRRILCYIWSLEINRKVLDTSWKPALLSLLKLLFFKPQMHLNPAEREPLIFEMFLLNAFCRDDFITGVLASGQIRGIRGNGHALFFPSFFAGCPVPLLGRLLVLPSFLPPSPLLPAPELTQVSPLPRSAAAHRFRFSILVLSQQVVARLNHSRISSCECATPPPTPPESKR